ncbi:Abi family protein [Enterobacter hormaechei]|uniref:Abi family protein n=1 Tax=Enterobacter hormaechei TaxID=158836 RepID=UPI0013E8FB47|nr:Abi family protein [Enterobacter hormaechei]KAF6530642.1 Abi family protein [Enterobacter hormaechei]KAF6530673.1 Abi family protein [Enterobacter hormaechei]
MYRISPENISKHINEISSLRIGSYKSFFKTASDEEAYGIYCWNGELSSRISLAIGIYEVLLRNRIHSALSNFFFNNKNFCNGPLNGTVDSCDWYNHISTTSKFSSYIKRELTDEDGKLLSPPPYPHQIISKLSHGKWRYAFKVTTASNGKNIPWDSLLPSVFPEYRSDFKKPSVKEAVFMRLKQVHLLRNRISHFEPIWKFGDLKNEAGNKSIRTAPKNTLECLGRTKTEYKYIVDIISWMSSDMYDFYEKTRNHKETLDLLELDAINSFKEKSQTIIIDLDSENLSQEIETAMSKSKQRNNKVELRKAGKFVAILR